MYNLHILQNDQNKWMAILGPMGNDKKGSFFIGFPDLPFSPASMIKSEGWKKGQIKWIVNTGFEISQIRMWNRQLFAFGCKVPRPGLGQGHCFVMHHVKCDWQRAYVCFEQGFHWYGDYPVKECHHICHTQHTNWFISDWQRTYMSALSQGFTGLNILRN